MNYVGKPVQTIVVEPVVIAHSSKMIDSKWSRFLHCILHLALIAASLGVIYWGLIMGRVFVPEELDYRRNPRILIPQPVDASKDGDGAAEE